MTDPHTLANSITTIYMAKEFTLGKTKGGMKVSGESTKCMERVLLRGKMDGNMSANTTKTKREVMASSCGPTDDLTEASGLMGANTEKEHSFRNKDKKDTESGETEKESDGSERCKKPITQRKPKIE